MLCFFLASQRYLEAPIIKGNNLKKLEKAEILSFAVLFVSDEDCRTCEDAVDEFNDVYTDLNEITDMY